MAFCGDCLGSSGCLWLDTTFCLNLLSDAAYPFAVVTTLFLDCITICLPFSYIYRDQPPFLSSFLHWTKQAKLFRASWQVCFRVFCLSMHPVLTIILFPRTNLTWAVDDMAGDHLYTGMSIFLTVGIHNSLDNGSSWETLCLVSILAFSTSFSTFKRYSFNLQCVSVACFSIHGLASSDVNRLY